MLRASGSETPAAAASPSPDRFLPARAVWERYNVSDETLRRWLLNEQKGFPKPIYFGRFRQWRLSDLERWEREQAAKRGGA
jgi:predicted DNA-binding transcriptional regulator AlpA